MADADETKPEVGNMEHVNIKVKSQDGAVVCFKAKRTTQFRKLMKAYCERQGLTLEQVSFLFEGNRVREEMTPTELDMDTDETLDVVIRQVIPNEAQAVEACWRR